MELSPTTECARFAISSAQPALEAQLTAFHVPMVSSFTRVAAGLPAPPFSSLTLALEDQAVSMSVLQASGSTATASVLLALLSVLPALVVLTTALLASTEPLLPREPVLFSVVRTNSTSKETALLALQAATDAPSLLRTVSSVLVVS